MSTKLYLTNTAAPVVPGATRGTWANTASAVDYALKTTKEGAYASRSLTPTQSTGGTLFYRLVSPPLAAPLTTSGSIDSVIMASASSSAAIGRYYVYVMAPDGSVRGTLAGTSNSNNNVSATLGGYQLIPNGNTVANVNALFGDRIVIEAGMTASQLAVTGVAGRGGTSTDISVGDTNTTHPGWIAFGANFVFNGEGDPDSGYAFIL